MWKKKKRRPQFTRFPYVGESRRKRKKTYSLSCSGSVNAAKMKATMMTTTTKKTAKMQSETREATMVEEATMEVVTMNESYMFFYI